MARRHYKLPPLTKLAAFETSARHGSFKNAAQELGVTPGAVSHQIKSLENELGITLFNRHHRGVEITREGKELFTVLEQSFSDISMTLSSIRKSEKKAVVTVSATTAFSSLWLTPRLTQLWKTCGEISVNQHVSDTPDPYEKIPDLRIVYGYRKKENPNLKAHKLFQDELIPVCSPAFLAQHSDTGLDTLATLPLIHLTAKDERWTTWHTWFKTMGYEGVISDNIRVNNYMIALQTASDDAGVVLGWKNLLKPLLERGSLVPFGTHTTPAPSAFYLISADEEKLSKNVRHVRDCLLNVDLNEIQL
jgi:DNA-binding transcriptional LysR family regulator